MTHGAPLRRLDRTDPRTVAAMARVTGIGGFFFRAQDPDALNGWYGQHFGIVMLESTTYEDPG